MPVIQCPNCQKSLNVKQVPPSGQIKCPGCGNAISLTGGDAGKARRAPARPAAAARPAGRRALTPEDEGFDFGQVQFPSPGPVVLSHFPVNPHARSVYQGPIPGDPLGESIGGTASQSAVGEGQPKGKRKGRLSPMAIGGILGGVVALVLVAIVVASLLSGSGESGDAPPSAPPAGQAP